MDWKFFKTRLAEIQALVDVGVLGPEECPREYGWHWPVLDETRLPEWAKQQYKVYGEVRW